MDQNTRTRNPYHSIAEDGTVLLFEKMISVKQNFRSINTGLPTKNDTSRRLHGIYIVCSFRPVARNLKRGGGTKVRNGIDR